MNLRAIITVLLQVILGAVFILSAISKIPTLESFGWTIAETGWFSWTVAEWLARLIIGIELFLGLLFLLNLRIRRLTAPFSLILLLAFTGYLIFVLFKYGNQSNCGCYGEWIPMTTRESIFKNIILIILVLLVWFLSTEWNFKHSGWIVFLLFIAGLVVPFAWIPPDSIYIFPKEGGLKEPFPSSLLYEQDRIAPQEDIRKGKRVIGIFSLTCKYCKKAAKKMRIMKERNAKLPFFFILNGDSTNLQPFLNETGARNIPFVIFNGPEAFLKIAGSQAVPQIKWVEDTVCVRKSNYITLKESEIEQWMNE